MKNKYIAKRVLHIFLAFAVAFTTLVGDITINPKEVYSDEVGDVGESEEIVEEWTDIGTEDGSIVAKLEVLSVSDDSTPSYKLTLSGEGDFGSRTTSAEYPWYQYRTMISEISIDPRITSIGAQAFQNSTKLTSVDFGGNSALATIGNDAFYSCLALAEITIPSTVTKIGSSAFSNCSGMKNVYFEENSVLESIDKLAFARCTSLITINLPDSLKTLGTQVFYNCKALTDVGITQTSLIESMDEQVFSGCSSLQSIVIPVNLLTIQNKMFNSCSNLENVTIASNAKLTAIGSYAFSGCSKLANINIPDTVKTIGQNAFFSCTKLTDVNINDTSAITEFADYTFANCEALKTINFPSGLTKIGNCTFQNCYSFGSLELPSGLLSIGEYAFENCWGITSAIIPESVTNISKYAFNKCKKLNEVSIPNTIETLYEYTFANCTSLENIIIPNSVKVIENRVFADSTKLASVTLPNALETLGERAFINCSTLDGIVLPDSITTIGGSAFYGCTSLSAINIPKGITTLEESLFYNCSSLTNIEIPNNITTVKANAFAGCAALEDVLVHISRGEGIEFVGQVFYPTNQLAADRIAYVLDNADAEGYTLEGVTFGTVELDADEEGKYTHDTKPMNVVVKSNYKPGVPTAYIDEVALENNGEYSYGESKLVTIKKTTGTDNSFVYYTLDGSEPTEDNGTKYEEPFLIDKTATLKIRSLEIGCISSEVVTSNIEIERTLTFDYATNGGGSVTKESQTVQYSDTVVLDITQPNVPTAQKDGYEFLGWNTDKDAHTVLTSITNFAEDTTVYAIYKKTVTAVFKNSNKEELKSVDFYNAEDITTAIAKAPSITKKSGWTSSGWRFAKNEEFGDDEPRPDIYAVGTNVPIRDGDMFEAVYTKNIKLAYNLNGKGATFDNEDEICVLSCYTITEGIDRSIEYFTVTDKTPTRTGYFFNGWGGSAASTEEEYFPGNTIMTTALEDNFNVYAIWTQKSYTLTETTVSGTFDDLYYDYKTSNAVVYTITNAGNSEVTNLKASIKTSDFTLSPLSKTALKPNETATITVSFPMGKDAATYTDVLTITGDNVREPLGINISQTVIPKAISIKSASVADKVYDGYTVGMVESIEFDGLDGYDFTVSDYTVKAEFEDPNVSFDAETGEEVVKEVTVTVSLKKNNFVLAFNEYIVLAKILRAEVPSVPEDSITAKCSHNNLSQTTDLLPEDWTWEQFSAITSGEKYTAVYKDINNFNNSSKEVTVYISTQHTYESEITTPSTCVTYGIRTYTCECGATYTEPVEKDGNNHINTTSVEKLASNCVEEGVMEYTCGDCGTVYEEPIPINETNHKGYVGKMQKKATCQSEGLTRYTCYCGHYYDVTVEKDYNIHEYVTTITKVPTCNEKGAANYDCPCGDHYSAELGMDKENHVGYVGVETIKPTCQKKGEMTYTCSGCGDKYTEPITEDPTYHVDYSWEDTTPATCQTEGVRTYTCICGDTYTTPLEIDRNNHVDYTEEVLEDATCKQTGKKRFTCACGYFYDEVIPIDYNAHKNVPEIIEYATCAASGKIKYTCIDCGNTYTGEYAKDPTRHTNYVETITQEPTCQTEGIMTYTCEGCGDQYTEDIALDPNNHRDFKSKITKVATCQNEGERTYTCACGYSYTEPMPIDSQRHENPVTYKTITMATCTKLGERLCTYACGHSYTEEIPVNLNNHSYVGVIEAEPTCQSEGIMRYTCNDCTRSYTDVIAKDHNNHVDYTPEEIKTATCSEYGEIRHTCLCGYSYIEEIEKNPLAHSQLVTRVEKVANCCEAGEEIHRCRGCDYEEVITTPLDPENHIHYSEEVELPATCMETGIMRHYCDGCGADYTTTISLDPYNHSFVDGVCEYCGSTEDEIIFSKVKSEYDGSNYTWEYKIKVKEGVAENPVVIFVAYGMDDSVVGVTITDIEPTENAVSVSGVTECTKPAKSYKIFLWDSIEFIRPLIYVTK